MKLDFATTALLTNMKLNALPPFSELTPDEARLVYSELAKSRRRAGTDNVSAENISIATTDGATIAARILRPEGEAKAVIVYFHGGGWVIGNIDDFDPLGRKLAEANQAVIVMVNYRKAPEHGFPVPMDDCWAALNHVAENKQAIAGVGGDVPLFVMGDSAGGNLAAATALRARDENGPQIDMQILVYPVIDGRRDTDSYHAQDKQLFLTAESMDMFWDYYTPKESDRLNPLASPILAEKLDGLPPAIVITAEFDILRDEGEAYAESLRAAGVPVIARRFDRQIHGFFSMSDILPVGAQAHDWLAGEIDRWLSPPAEVDAIVVGAGFSGMYQLHKLRDMGLSVRVFEAGDDVGGTWYWNRYPGARVDIESLAYSYSFSEELEQDWVWTEKYAAQPELLRYCQHVAERFDLRRDISFNTRVVSAHYMQDKAAWLVTTDSGERVTANYLIMATGVLSSAKTPDIPGRDDFKGDTYQTGRWPHEGVDFTGKRVAVIGTGSSAVQSIPLIAEQAKELVVYQRTAAYSTPAHNRPLTNAEISDMKEHYRAFRETQRLDAAGIPNPERQPESVFDVSEEERNRRFEQAWDEGLLTGLSATFSDLGINEEANNLVAEFIRDRIRATVKDAQTAEDLVPKAYPYATKRPCIDTNYYETYNRENVSLVNLRRTPIKTITPTGIATTQGTQEFDAIVFATGFDAMTGALMAIDIRGTDGQRLADDWAGGPRCYLGLAISGFPNLFTITGPSSPSVLSNMLVSIEQHVDWVTDCIGWMRAHDYASIEATQEAENEWADHTAHLAGLTLLPKADSWYMGANVPGKPRMFLAYVGGVGVYRKICDAIAADDYHGFKVTPKAELKIGQRAQTAESAA